MAYPQVTDTATSGLATDNTSHSASLPTSPSGELLLLFISLYADGLGDNADISSGPSGWTLLGTPNSSESHLTYVYAKVSSGSEGASVSFTTTDNTFDSCACFSISGWSGTVGDLTISSVASGNSDSPNPGNCNPGTSAEYLWIVFTGFVDDGATVSSYPTDFSDNQTYKDNGGGSNEHVTVAVATREYTGSSLDPGTYTLSETEGWEAWTVAVLPSSGPAWQINIGDAWKTVEGVQINIGDAWKTVDAAQINIGDAWKASE